MAENGRARRAETPFGAATELDAERRSASSTKPVCLLTAAPTLEGLAQQLAAYAREQAPLQLRLRDAARIAELAALGRYEEVIAHYFRAVARGGTRNVFS